MVLVSQGSLYIEECGEIPILSAKVVSLPWYRIAGNFNGLCISCVKHFYRKNCNTGENVCRLVNFFGCTAIW